MSRQHIIWYIEKLVIAEYAKQGKADTFCTMLAAIFEENRLVQPTIRVKNNKARKWLTQMSQMLMNEY